MNRLAALLLVLLLPCGALAETFKLTIKTEMSEAFADELVQMLTPENADAVSASRADLILQIVQRIVNDFTLELTMQEDASVGHVYMGCSELMDMTIYNLNGMSYLTSSLLAGYALAERAPYSADTVESTDWAKLSTSTEGAIRIWLAERAPVTTYGAFAGDAYDGGTRCTTWTFTEQDISALLSSILSSEMREALTSWLLAAGFDADDIFKRADDRLNIPDDVAYSFILRWVEDDAEELVGLSLTIQRGQVQIASISIGAGEIGSVVVGLGLPTENYWWKSTLRKASLGNMTEYSGISREWTAPKEQSFAYVQASSQPKAQYGWSFTTRSLANASKWSAALFPVEGAAKDEAMIAVEVNVEPAEKIAPMPDVLTICSYADTETYEALVNQFTAALAARMIKLLPMDLIFRLNMLP